MFKKFFSQILMIAEKLLGCGGALMYFAGFGSMGLWHVSDCPADQHGNREANKKNKPLKILLWGLVIGLVGMAVTMGVAVGSGRITSRETEEIIAAGTPFESVILDTTMADVQFVTSDSYEVEAYTKAWRPSPIDINEVVHVSVDKGVLTITETGFPNDFLGIFPQPYELGLTIYAPEGVTTGGAS